jgi:hypothetical protein
MDYEVIYIGRSNSIDFTLKSNSSAYDLASVVRMTLSFGDKAVDSSNTTVQGITWNKLGYETGEVRINLGHKTTLTTGLFDAPLIVYEGADVNGVFWGTIPICIKANAEGSTTT